MVRRSLPPLPWAPDPLVSEVRGVGSNSKDDQAAAPVRGADVVRSYNAPFRIEPETGKVTQDGVEAESKVIRDVLKDRESGS